MRKHKLLLMILGAFGAILLAKHVAVSAGALWALYGLLVLVIGLTIGGVLWVTGVFRWIKKFLG